MGYLLGNKCVHDIPYLKKKTMNMSSLKYSTLTYFRLSNNKKNIDLLCKQRERGH